MGNEPPPPTAPSSPPPPGGLETFRCDSCQYDLTGLGREGVCPECAHPFDKAEMVRRAAEWAAYRAKRRIIRAVFPLVLLAMFSPCAGVLIPERLSETVEVWPIAHVIVPLLVWAIGVVGWMRVDRPTWRHHAERLLLFVLPLLVITAMVYFNPDCSRLWLVAVVVPIALTVRAALRRAPRPSELILLFFGIGPLLLLPVALGVHGLTRWNKGYVWSEIDFRYASGWRAVAATQCLWLAAADLAATAALSAIIISYARWARRQPPPPAPSSPPRD